MNEVKFEFGAPEHGWMDASITDGERKVTFLISDVPCNSINKLTNILLDLQSGAKAEEVEFSLEPDFALWRFHAKDEELEVHVFENSNRTDPVIFTGKRKKVIHRLYKALRDLESLQCWKEPAATSNYWSWEFPSQELNKFSMRDKSA